MAYETASATSAADLVDKIRTFAAANGWTVDFNGARTDGPTGTAIAIHKGATFAVFASNTSAGNSDDPGPYLQVYTYPGPYSGGANVMAQANKSAGVKCNKMTGPFQAYHLFASGEYLHVVVELTPGLFRHAGVGVMEKAGALTTAVYNFGLRWNYSSSYIDNINGLHAIPWECGMGTASDWGTEIRVDSDGVTPRNIILRDSAPFDPNGGWCGATFGSVHEGGPIKGLIDVGPSSITGRAVLAPIIVGIDRPSGFISLVGAAPDIRQIRLDNLNAGDAVSIGPDTWRVFPVVRKNGGPGLENSGVLGYAYRVVS